MKLISTILVFFSTSFFYAAGFGHVKETIISGRVINNDDSSPLEGATVVVKGTKNITGTMPDGAFSLLVSKNDTVLIVSLNGYETKQIKITNETFYEIVLSHAGGISIEKNSFHKQAIVTINR
jgi:aspartate 1-decarboxylase